MRLLGFQFLSQLWSEQSSAPRMTPNPSINRTCPGKPGHAGYLKR